MPAPVGPSQGGVWVSWPGGIGWPTPIPLSGGKRKSRKASKKSRKAQRKRRSTTRRR